MSRIVTIALSLSILIGLASSPTAGQGPPRRKPYLSRCGSEIAWIEDFEEAARIAKETRRPVLWFVPTARRTAMDRKQEIFWYMMAGPFMDPALIDLIGNAFVPLKLGMGPVLRRGFTASRTAPADQAKKLADRYGLKLVEFIEPGIIILDRKMKTLQVMDRLVTYNSHWMMERLRALAAAHPSDFDPTSWPTPKKSVLDDAVNALRAGQPDEAMKLFDGHCATLGLAGEGTRAAYFAGVCRHMTRRTAEGDALWKELAAKAPDDRWAWKAKIELERWGPFTRGFEEYRDYPERVMNDSNLRTTRADPDPEHMEQMVDRAIGVILALQRDHGGWDDSTYDFGGVDSLPNVYVAVTALSAQALLEWRGRNPERVDSAIDAAIEFLLDERNVNAEDRDELVWAHVYRLLFFARVIEERPQEKERLGAKMEEIVAALEESQVKSGAWRHEYANPFATASVLHAMTVAAKTGIKVKRGMLKSGAKALAGTRSKNGAFSYGMGRRGSPSLEASGGRVPLCELALFLNGESSKKKLAKAISISMEQHVHLEEVRQYDDHAAKYRIGGFFFWYDMLGRSDAIESCPSPQKKAWKRKMVELIHSIHEVDGSWIDSHELGKSYGTAMGLISLKKNLDPSQ